MSTDLSNRNHLKALSAIRERGVQNQDRGLLHSTVEETIEGIKNLDKVSKGLGVGVMKEEGTTRHV